MKKWNRINIAILLFTLTIFFGCKKNYPKGGIYILEISINGTKNKIEGTLDFLSSNRINMNFTKPFGAIDHIRFNKGGNYINGEMLWYSGSVYVCYYLEGQTKFDYYRYKMEGEARVRDNINIEWSIGKFKLYKKFGN